MGVPSRYTLACLHQVAGIRPGGTSRSGHPVVQDYRDAGVTWGGSRRLRGREAPTDRNKDGSTMFGMSFCLGFSRFVLALPDGQIAYREILPSHVSPIRKVTVIVGGNARQSLGRRIPWLTLSVVVWSTGS